jgi:hypothetical protein
MATWMEIQQDFNVILRQAQAEAQEENG